MGDFSGDSHQVGVWMTFQVTATWVEIVVTFEVWIWVPWWDMGSLFEVWIWVPWWDMEHFLRSGYGDNFSELIDLERILGPNLNFLDQDNYT